MLERAGYPAMLPATLQFLILMIATAINDRLWRKLDYSREEVSVLKEQLAALTGARSSPSPPTRAVASSWLGSCSPPRSAGSAASSSSRRRFWRGSAKWLRHVVKEFSAHYHAERFHQGLGARLIKRQAGSRKRHGAGGKVICRSRLGGMLNFYLREAA